MASFNVSCPKCGLSFEVEEELIGEDAECPNCSTVFPLKKPASGNEAKQVPLTAVAQSSKIGFLKRKYVFGRTAIALAWLFAALFFVASIFLAVTRRSSAREGLEHSQQDTRQIVSEQKEILSQYNDIVARLGEKKRVDNNKSADVTIVVSSGDKTSSKVYLDNDSVGIKIPKNLQLIDKSFNEMLNSKEDICQSLQALGEVKEKTEGLMALFNSQFENNLVALRTLAEKRMPSSSSSPSEISKIKIASSGIKISSANIVDFYASSDDKAESLDIIFKASKQLAECSWYKQEEQLQRETAHFVSFANFIKDSLLNKQRDFYTAGVRGDFANTSASSGADKNTAEIEKRRLLHAFELVLEEQARSLSKGWSINAKLEGLSCRLEKRLETQRNFERQRSEIDMVFMKQVGLILLFCLGVMLLADYLRAHFDMAESVSRKG